MAKLGEMSAVVAPLLAFGLHEALDQIGATIGPLVLKVVIAQSMDHRRGFLALLVPAVAALPTLSVAASPSASSESGNGGGLPHRLWSFSEGVLGVRVRQCAGRCGLCRLSILAYHFGQASTVSLAWIPALYALAITLERAHVLLYRAGAREAPPPLSGRNIIGTVATGAAAGVRTMNVPENGVLLRIRLP